MQRPVSSSPEIKVDQLFVSGKGRRVITKGREFKAMRGSVSSPKDTNVWWALKRSRSRGVWALECGFWSPFVRQVVSRVEDL